MLVYLSVLALNHTAAALFLVALVLVCLLWLCCFVLPSWESTPPRFDFSKVNTTEASLLSHLSHRIAAVFSTVMSAVAYLPWLCSLATTVRTSKPTRCDSNHVHTTAMILPMHLPCRIAAAFSVVLSALAPLFWACLASNSQLQSMSIRSDFSKASTIEATLPMHLPCRIAVFLSVLRVWASLPRLCAFVTTKRRSMPIRSDLSKAKTQNALFRCGSQLVLSRVSTRTHSSFALV